ncbi:hypothetical protein N0V82_007622 [Gnomoniopsis sp. IMI 355080]|nr:hypothetical protein N0V82_007622 [Gnomoniopsis sp. IMI 355080]
MDVPLAEDREFAMLDPNQISVLNAVERMGATLSLFGIILIFITFAFFKRLRTIPNTFIFFASIANIGACVACLIAYDGITALHEDVDSPLCQAQGFIFECVLSAVIYFAVGYHVFHQRNQLRNLSLSTQGKDLAGDSTDVRDSAEKNLTSHAGPHYYGSVTTEIQVTSAAIPIPRPAYTNPFETSPRTTHTNSAARRPSAAPPTLRVNTDDPTRTTTSAPDPPSALSLMHTHNYPWSAEPSTFADSSTNDSTAATLVNSTTSPFTSPFSATAPRSFENANHSFNTSQYTSISAEPPSKVAEERGPSPTRLLTASSKRSPTSGDSETLPTVHSHPHTKRGSDETTTSSGGGAHSGGNSGGNFFRRMSLSTRRFGARLKHMDPVKLAYLRTSFVFAISILVTWTPSSINRVYTLIYPDKASYGLNIAAAVVLPLQGVWNAVIYFTTSWKIFREEMEATRTGRRLLRVLRLGSRSAETGPRQSGGSFALGSSERTPRSEMGRNRRLEGESLDNEGVEGVEMRSPMSSPRPQQSITRMSTMRVTQKQLDDFA